MAYKFQLGAYTASGSLVQEGAVEVDALTADSMNLQSGGITNAGSIAGASSIDGSGDLTMGTITMSGFAVDADGDTALKSLKVDDSSTIGCDSDADLMTLSDGLVVVAGEMQVTTLDIGGTNVSATAAEINYLDNDDLVAGDITKLAALTATAAEINLLDDVDRGSIIYGNASGASAKLAKGSAHEFLQSDGTDIAYVAMSGDATLNAGAITIANNAVSLAKMAGLARGKFIIGDASGDPSALALGSAGQMLVSDGDDLAYRSVSGDATLGADGALTIANDAVEQAMIADDAVGADQLASNAVVDASVASNAAIAANKINFNVDLGGDIAFGNQANDTISTAGHFTIGGNLTVQGSTTTVDSTTINISSSFTFEGPADAHETILSCATPGADTTLSLPTLSAGSYFIPALADAASDASAAVTAAEFALLDGGSTVGTSALASGDGFMHNDGGTMKHTSVDKIADFFAGAGLAASSGVLSVDIDELSALGGTGVAQGDHFIFSDNGTEKKITASNLEDWMFGNVSGDATIAAGGALTIAADAVEGSMLNDNVISGQTELASGNAVDADEIMISDAGTLKKIGLDSLKVYMSDIAAVIQNVAAAGTLVVGVNYFSDMSADGEDAVTLPASPSVGQSVKVKAPSDCSAARYITINKAGSQTIDGAAAIRLESPFAAVELVYVASNLWRVF